MRSLNRVFAIAVLFVPCVAFSQTQIGIKAGLNVSDIVVTNYVDPDFESDLVLKVGLHAGFYLSGTMNERMGMVAELLYSDKGTGDIHLHYITLPLLIDYKLSDRVSAEIGPEPGYLFSARSKYGNVINTYNNKFDLALDGGFRFNASRTFLSLRYCAGLFSVRNTEAYAAPRNEKIKYQNRVLQFSLGYRLVAEE